MEALGDVIAGVEGPGVEVLDRALHRRVRARREIDRPHRVVVTLLGLNARFEERDRGEHYRVRLDRKAVLGLEEHVCELFCTLHGEQMRKHSRRLLAPHREVHVVDVREQQQRVGAACRHLDLAPRQPLDLHRQIRHPFRCHHLWIQPSNLPNAQPAPARQPPAHHLAVACGRDGVELPAVDLAHDPAPEAVHQRRVRTVRPPLLGPRVNDSSRLLLRQPALPQLPLLGAAPRIDHAVFRGGQTVAVPR
mmetsp:Transcript_42394/g.99550  ORF Transcript_42394/g.99550 Transcript_42394/m.99550 type:complete len:249 (-) Transcript_42394:1819-2565(-)